ncbi:MAG: hypothetical protein ACP5I6_08030 [Caldisphaera sp.]|jgi:hypothetical protein|nr:hypothetical protein [Caldisphaera sp.]PMP90184.1 MAG: hypothetical protein C0171_05675 [Caldisphaera sp.]
MSGSNKIYTKYKTLVEMLNLRQLDVYRIKNNDGKTMEIIRVLDPVTRKVVNVNLNAVRESLNYVEFLNKIKEGLSAGGVNINERIWKNTIKQAEKIVNKQK